MNALSRYVEPTEFFDRNSDEVQGFARACTRSSSDAKARAVDLFYAVRDGIHYEIYGMDLRRPEMRASAVLRQGRGFCLHKAIVYVASARALGIPARIALSDVRNHLSTARLRKLIGGDVFHFHGYAEVWLGDRWIKTTPVFNLVLCKLFGMQPLEFDGTGDAVLQPYDSDGLRHMEFLRHHGSFAEFPYELCVDGLRQHHPALFSGARTTHAGSLTREHRSEMTIDVYGER